MNKQVYIKNWYQASSLIQISILLCLTPSYIFMFQPHGKLPILEKNSPDEYITQLAQMTLRFEEVNVQDWIVNKPQQAEKRG